MHRYASWSTALYPVHWLDSALSIEFLALAWLFTLRLLPRCRGGTDKSKTPDYNGSGRPFFVHGQPSSLSPRLSAPSRFHNDSNIRNALNRLGVGHCLSGAYKYGLEDDELLIEAPSPTLTAMLLSYIALPLLSFAIYLKGRIGGGKAVEPPIVDLGYAKYQGVPSSRGNTDFRGIRYAAPPTGECFLLRKSEHSRALPNGLLKGIRGSVNRTLPQRLRVSNSRTLTHPGAQGFMLVHPDRPLVCLPCPRTAYFSSE